MSTRSANAARSSAGSGITTHIAADTAGSAREVAEWGDKRKASLAPALAAEIYGLDVLASHVEDEAHNTTRFIILSRTSEWPPANNGTGVTTFVFRVRNVPAALYKTLGGFATNGVNMTCCERCGFDHKFGSADCFSISLSCGRSLSASKILPEVRALSCSARRIPALTLDS